MMSPRQWFCRRTNKVRPAAIITTVALISLTACSEHNGASPDMDVILAETPAATLSAYGLFEDAGASAPNHQLVAYDLTNPLFSDYATKQRYVFVPKGKTVNYDAMDAFAFPVGTVLVKTFGYAPDLRAPQTGAYKVETRLLIHKADGWAALPYVWNQAQTEAVYTPIGAKRDIDTISPSGEMLHFTYSVPNTNQCKTCHQSKHDIEPIGPKARNLNHDGQLEAWAAQGRLVGLPASAPSVPSAFDPDARIDLRARAYLDINCSHCHKADGSASNSGLWLDWNETSAVRRGIGKHPTAAGRGAGRLDYIIEPGDPASSILAYRMASTEAGIAMPELGRSLQHTEGVALVNQWISSMNTAED